jgi:hypothetical protein
MIDRNNRRSLALIGFLLLVGGGLSAALGGGAFGNRRADRDIFDTTLIRWWNEGGWESFAVVTAIGFVLAVMGAVLVLRQLHRNDGRAHTPNVTFPADGTPGETTLRSPALSRNLEADLERIPDVDQATVRLFGEYPRMELRAVLTVGDQIDLDGLPGRVDEALDRVTTTAGVRPDPVQVTLRFKAAAPDRQLT